MIHRIKDTHHTFLLITVPVSEPYQVLYMVMPEINQVQMVARQGKWSKSGNYHKDQWQAIDCGPRTTKEKLPQKWTVPVSIDEITLEQVKQFCPEVGDVQYSIKMLEDMKIRNYSKFKYNHE